MRYASHDLCCMSPTRSALSPQDRFLTRPQLLMRISSPPWGGDSRSSVRGSGVQHANFFAEAAAGSIRGSQAAVKPPVPEEEPASGSEGCQFFEWS
jgi:hypothetical protein